MVLLGSVGDSPSFEGSGASCAPGDTNIVGSVFRLFIFPFIFLSMVAWGGAHKYTFIKYATNNKRNHCFTSTEIKIRSNTFQQPKRRASKSSCNFYTMQHEKIELKIVGTKRNNKM